ncbi:LAMTOR4 family protein [Megaselia abdita]
MFSLLIRRRKQKQIDIYKKRKKNIFSTEMENIANQIGFLVLKDDGAVLESGGDLENDEKSANIFMRIVRMTESVDTNFMEKNGCERISIVYDDHSYTVCMSNKKIYIIKRRHINSSPDYMSSKLLTDTSNVDDLSLM